MLQQVTRLMRRPNVSRDRTSHSVHCGGGREGAAVVAGEDVKRVASGRGHGFAWVQVVEVGCRGCRVRGGKEGVAGLHWAAADVVWRRVAEVAGWGRQDHRGAVFAGPQAVVPKRRGGVASEGAQDVGLLAPVGGLEVLHELE